MINLPRMSDSHLFCFILKAAFQRSESKQACKDLFNCTIFYFFPLSNKRVFMTSYAGLERKGCD